MSARGFEIMVGAVALLFTAIFAAMVVPALTADFDPVGAALSGFVNPYASGYAWDAILCWVILSVWILYERQTLQVKYGWICIALGLVPGVAVGFGLYLILRMRTLKSKANNAH